MAAVAQMPPIGQQQQSLKQQKKGKTFQVNQRAQKHLLCSLLAAKFPHLKTHNISLFIHLPYFSCFPGIFTTWRSDLQLRPLPCKFGRSQRGKQSSIRPDNNNPFHFIPFIHCRQRFSADLQIVPRQSRQSVPVQFGGQHRVRAS